MTVFEKDKVLPRGTGKHTSFYRQYGITMAEMARRSGVTKECIRKRYQRGIRVDGPNRAEARRTTTLKLYEGKTRREWARELNVPLGSVLYRLKQRQKRSSDAN